MAKKTITKTNAKTLAEVYVVNDYAKGLEHNYDVVRDNEMDVTILKFSNHPYWSQDVQNTAAASLIDDGDSVNISIDDVHVSLDYDQIERLTALILACNTCIMELRKPTVIASLNKVN